MRFVCESCQTRYVVPDERIRGRTLKVRCKKCGNAILVKGGVQEGQPDSLAGARPAPEQGELTSEATQMVDALTLQKLRAARHPTMPATVVAETPVGGETMEWHVILDREQLGPLPLSALIQKMIGGEMGPRAYVWRDGMSNWSRAQEVPEVARWLPAARPSTSPSSSPARGPPAAPAAATENGRWPPRREPEDHVAEQFFAARESPHGSSPDHRTPTDELPRLDTDAELSSVRPGELTRFFITQAHISKGRSPWAVMAFGVGAAILLVGAVVGLAQLGVPVPMVTESPGQGPKVFSGAQGDSRMRDLLLGRHKASPAGSPGSVSSRAAPPQGDALGQGSAQGPLAKRPEQHIDRLGQSDKDQLSKLYAAQDLSKLKLKPTESGTPILDRPDAPLTAEQVSRTVAKFQTGYTRCIDGELKRNPNFQGGKIRIVTTIMSSGLVRQAQIVSDDQRLQRSVAGGPLGSCLSEQTRRMVFPSFQGDPFDAEIPLVLSSAL